MKAIRLNARGGPESLRFEDAPAPRSGPGEVLVRAGAAAVTPTELLWMPTRETRDGAPAAAGHPGARALRGGGGPRRGRHGRRRPQAEDGGRAGRHIWWELFRGRPRDGAAHRSAAALPSRINSCALRSDTPRVIRPPYSRSPGTPSATNMCSPVQMTSGKGPGSLQPPTPGSGAPSPRNRGRAILRAGGVCLGSALHWWLGLLRVFPVCNSESSCRPAAP
jgi:hypothetical protein